MFPLPETAAVDHLLMRVGERTIEGQIREREQAKAEYQQARGRGAQGEPRRAGAAEHLHDERREPGPGRGARASRSSSSRRWPSTRARCGCASRSWWARATSPAQELLEGIDGLGWSPDTDRGRRRLPGHPAGPASGGGSAQPGARSRSSSTPASRSRRSISRYHAIVTEKTGEGRYRVRLRDELVPADRDFELAWTPRPGTMPRAPSSGGARGRDLRSRDALPARGTGSRRRPLAARDRLRDRHVGIDGGLSIQQARKALLLAIDRLRPADRFNVIRVQQRHRGSLGRDAVGDARRTGRPPGGGSTSSGRTAGPRWPGALEAALVGSDDPSLVRQVVFLTDGSVGNEDELFGIIRQRLGDTRLFTVGIGSAPNSHFMTKAAGVRARHLHLRRRRARGRGEDGAALRRPGEPGADRHRGAAGRRARPSRRGRPRIPDLYLGEPVVVSARLSGPAGQVAVSRPARERGVDDRDGALRWTPGRRGGGALGAPQGRVVARLGARGRRPRGGAAGASWPWASSTTW